jgi:photosystem II stability/assembly factor-like uncharacterized protein
MKSALIFFFFLILLSIPGKGQWAQVNKNLDGCSVVAMTKIGEKILVGTTGGVFITDNNGASWSAVSDLIGYYTHSILAVGNTVYVSSQSGENFKSVDGGISWTPILAGSFVRRFLAIDNTVFALTIDGKLFKIDGNSSVATLLSTGLTGVSSIAIKGSRIFLGTSASGMYSSTDMGSTWNPVHTGFSGSIFQIESSGSMILARLFSSGTLSLIISTDDAVTWKSTGISSGIICLGAINSKFFLGTSQGVLTSTDNGDTWNPFNGLPIGTGGLVANSSGFYFGTSLGVHYSTDTGLSWTPANVNLTARYVTRILDWDNRLIAISNGKIFKSDNQGTDWAPLNPGNSMNDIFYVSTATSRNLLASTFSSGVFISFNKGETWTPVSGLTGAKMFAQVEARVYAASTDGIYVSTDFGSTWTKFSELLTSVSALAGSGSFLFVGYANGSVLRFTADGLFTSVQSGLPSSDQVTSFVFSDGQSFCSTLNNGVYISSNDGLSWSAINNGLTGQMGIQSLSIANKKLYAARSKQGIFYSIDKGATWSSYNTGFPNGILTGPVNFIQPVGNKLYAATNANGIWMNCSVQDKPTITADLTNPLEALLTSSITEGNQWFQNGNPISGATQNKFTTSESGSYSVAVTTLDGCTSPKSEEVTIIITGVISDQMYNDNVTLHPNPASQSVTLDLSNCKNGTPITLSIVDGAGNRVFQSCSTGGEKIQIPVSSYSTGTYFLRVYQGNKNKWVRFIKVD